jgi:hypothetical protein
MAEADQDNLNFLLTAAAQNSVCAQERPLQQKLRGNNQAGFVMTSITATSHAQAAGSRDRQGGLLHNLRAFWRQFASAAFDPYRPELHYMRGPGPAWRAKHAASSIPDLT